jgi:hypothetical protein
MPDRRCVVSSPCGGRPGTGHEAENSNVGVSVTKIKKRKVEDFSNRKIEKTENAKKQKTFDDVETASLRKLRRVGNAHRLG